MEMLSPGVYITETDKSTVVTASSNSVGVFAGDFVKGPVGGHSLINTIDELIANYGKPTAKNFNDWFQASTYLNYASQLYVSRACNYKGDFKPLGSTVVKKVGQEVERIEGVKAKCDFAEAQQEGIAGNNLVVSIDDGDPIVTTPSRAASCDYATAKVKGEDGNQIKIKIEKTGSQIVQEAVKATCDLATAKTAGSEGNKIRVEITQTKDKVTQNHKFAECDLATSKLRGAEGNNLKIVVSGQSGNWKIEIKHKNQTVQTLQSISNDTEPTLLESAYVTFKDHIPFTVKEYVLTGGTDEIKVPTYQVSTFKDDSEEDKQENVLTPDAVTENALVTFHIKELKTTSAALKGGKDAVEKDVFKFITEFKGEAKDTQSNITDMTELSDNSLVIWKDSAEISEQREGVQLTGGTNEVSTPSYIFRTYDSTRPYEAVEQRNVQAWTDLRDNEYVTFIRTHSGAIETGDYELSGGEDGFGGGLDYSKVQVSSLKGMEIGGIIKFDNSDDLYMITDVDTGNLFVVLDRQIEMSDLPELESPVYDVQIALTGVAEAVDETATTPTNYLDDSGTMQLLMLPKDIPGYKLFGNQSKTNITNSSAFDELRDSISFTSADSKIKFYARNPGTWSKSIKICIARPEAFELNNTSEKHIPHYAFPGILIDDLFEYAPKENQIAVCVWDDDQKGVVETFLCSLDKEARDSSNRAIFIESVINKDSRYLFCKVNSASKDNVADYTLRFTYDALGNETYVGKNLTLTNYRDSEIQNDDLIDAYNLFGNKEEIDIDNIIANERDEGRSARQLAEMREDCICFIGCNYSDVVNKKSIDAIENLVKWRRTGALNFNSMFCCALANYIQIYDQYNNVNRWINVAGSCAGLRAQTSKNYETWFASAGLERGQLLNVIKLAFNPTEAQRDTLYKNALNPICTFTGQGTVLYGQKTLLDTGSSFSRVNIRSLFNNLERALGKMAKTSVMEFNDSYTRNSIVSVIKPYLAQVQAGRGIQSFLVVCDNSNNPPQVVASNQMVVDIYIQPTYVAEFVRLNFVNNGVNSITTVSTV